MARRFLPGPLHVLIIWVLHWEIQEKTHTLPFQWRRHTPIICVWQTLASRFSLSTMISNNTWKGSVSEEDLLQWPTCSSSARLITVIKKYSDGGGDSLYSSCCCVSIPLPSVRSHLVNHTLPPRLGWLLTSREPPPQHLISWLTVVGACELSQDAEGARLSGAGARLPVLSVLNQPLLAAVIGDKTRYVLHPEAVPVHTHPAAAHGRRG